MTYDTTMNERATCYPFRSAVFGGDTDGLPCIELDGATVYRHAGPFCVECQDAIAGWVDELHQGVVAVRRDGCAPNAA